MPMSRWDSKDQWLMSKDRLEEMLQLLKEGDSETVVGLLENVLDEMNKS